MIGSSHNEIMKCINVCFSVLIMEVILSVGYTHESILKFFSDYKEYLYSVKEDTNRGSTMCVNDNGLNTTIPIVIHTHTHTHIFICICKLCKNCIQAHNGVKNVQEKKKSKIKALRGY